MRRTPLFFECTSLVKRRMPRKRDVRQCRQPETLIMGIDMFSMGIAQVTLFPSRPCRHPNLYRLILMVPGLNDNNSRSLKRRMSVENHLKGSRKQVQKIPFDLRGVSLTGCGARQ